MEDDKFSWDNPFSACDFFDTRFHRFDDNITRQRMAETANARFREIIKEHGKMVYRKSAWGGHIWGEIPISEDTHTAILICEKEIKDE